MAQTTDRLAGAPRRDLSGAPRLDSSRRLVVKIGSALLVGEDGRLASDWLDTIAADIAGLRAGGTEVIVVSSGAIALARATVAGLAGGTAVAGTGSPRRLRLEEKQAAAAIGQIRLAQAWSEALARQGLVAAQLLLTMADSEDRRRYLNARATLATLAGLGAIPVINENDTVATAEIRFGDNDRLAARVAEMVQADQLVLLSDIDGLYTADPRRVPDATHVPVVEAITPAIEAMGGDPPPGYSSGGMRTKLAAARLATASGCAMAIALGRVAHPLAALGTGARCTWFLPAVDGRSARKRWIAGSLQPMGALVVDDGAAHALSCGRSLLPAGVIRVEGAFGRGDPVRIVDTAGRTLARALSAYSSTDSTRIAGLRSEQLERALGWRGRDEIVHRDDLALASD